MRSNKGILSRLIFSVSKKIEFCLEMYAYNDRLTFICTAL